MALSKDDILATDLPRIEVQVPEWNGSVFVRQMTSTEKDAYETEMYQARKKQEGSELINLRARNLIRTISDENNTRVFEDSDVDALGEKSGLILDRLFDASEELNETTEEGITELVGESQSVQS